MKKDCFCDFTVVLLMRKTVVALNNYWNLFFLINCFLEYQKSLEKEKKQLVCKPGSVSYNIRCLSFI